MHPGHINILKLLICLPLANAGWAQMLTSGDNLPLLFGGPSTPTERVANPPWPDAVSDAIVETHEMALNLDALQSVEVETESQKTRSYGPIVVGQSFGIILPHSSRALKLQVAKVEQLVSGVITYSGTLPHEPGAHFTLSIRNNRLHGQIVLGGVSYVIEPLKRQLAKHRVILLDRELLPRADDSLSFNEGNREAETGAPNGSNGTTSTLQGSSSGSGNVRVLFLFANNVSSQSTMAANIVSEFNNALSRSVVSSGNSISSTNVITVSDGFDDPTDCRGKILYDMHARNAPFQNIDQWLDISAADLAFLVVKTGATSTPCPSGIDPAFNVPGRIGGVSTGFFPGTAGIQDHSTSPFALSMDSYALGNFNGIHEIGHSLGGQHADITASTTSQFASGDASHGYENDNAGQWQTIMGGYNTSRCAFDFDEADPTQQPCQRIAYFSNPALAANVNGSNVTIGTSLGDGGTNNDGGQRKADMETWLEQSGMPIVSEYVLNAPPPSSAPYT